MKLNKAKNFTQKSYICNIKKRSQYINSIILLLLVFSMVLGLVGCGISSDNKTNINPEQITGTDAEQETLNNAKEKSLEIAMLYRDIYANAEKTISDYYYNQTVVSQSVIDEIELLLCDKGYPVLNSDSKYPSYLENADSFHQFWEKVSQNKDAKQEFISVSLTGELYYTALHYTDGKKYRASVGIGWDADNKPIVTMEIFREVMDWELITETDFYYQTIYPTDIHCDDYTLVRLQPVDKTMYDLTEKYLSHIGYLSNNMFVSEWSYKDYGNLSFNDLLEFFYRNVNNDYFYDDEYETVREPYWHTNIPATLFEETILPYFDISLQEFRTRSLYDSEKNMYPWQEVCCDNVTYYPSVEPEVVKYQENDDGTLTLTVNVRCNDYKTDKLFTHEVVICVLDNGQYQYLSNKITHKGDIELPPDRPRLPPQRINEIQ